MATLSQTFFRTSAILFGVSILGHVRFGLKAVYPALATIPSTHEHPQGKLSARNSYDFANITMGTIALLNWQWSRTLGPQTIEEKMILCAVTLFCGLSTWRFTKAGLYGPLIVTVVAPVCSLLGWANA